MKTYSKIIAAFLAALMCLSVCMFSVYAESMDDPAQPADPGGGQSSSDSSAQSSDTPYIPEPEPPVQSSDYESDVPYIPEQDQSSYYDDGGYDSQTSYENEVNESSNNNVYYDSDGNSYSNQDDVYVGGGQSYQPPVSTAPPAALYKTEKKIDVNELSKNDWGDISKMLKNAGKNESGGDDFAFIQNNTSKADNGHWIIIGGIICIGLSVAGFIYLIASKINRNKKIKAGNISKNTPQKNNAQYRANDDYNDGYGSASSENRQPEKTKSSGHYGGGKSGKGGRRYR